MFSTSLSDFLTWSIVFKLILNLSHWMLCLLNSKDGDLTNVSSLLPGICLAQVLHYFPIEPASLQMESNERASLDLPRRLELSVSEVGVVGRKASIMDSLGPRCRILAEGVIGWN